MNDPTAATRRQQERERKEAMVKAYRALWNDSEAILDILRRESAKKLKPLTDEELIAWAEKK